MNIGIATDTYFPRVNGVAHSINSFSQAFRQRGHHVFIFAPGYPEARVSEPEVWRFPAHHVSFSPEDYLPNPWGWRGRKMLAQVPELKLDIIHTQTPFSLGWAMLKQAQRLKLPVLHTYHTLFEAYLPHYFKFWPHRWNAPLAAWYSRFFCNQHQCVIAPSRAIAERLRSYGVKTPIQILSTGVDLTPFQELDGQRWREKLGLKPKDILLLAMGRVAREKNIPFLFDVLKILSRKRSGIYLIVAGQGPALAEVQAECQRQGLETLVKFVGFLPTRDWVDLYAAADLSLLASTTETQGLVLTEAMAAGTPCVAVAAMGVCDVMAQGGGLTAPLQAEAFAQAVEQLLSDKKLYAQKVAEAKQQAQAWSAERKAEELLQIYQRLITSYPDF